MNINGFMVILTKNVGLGPALALFSGPKLLNVWNVDKPVISIISCGYAVLRVENLPFRFGQFQPSARSSPILARWGAGG